MLNLVALSFCSLATFLLGLVVFMSNRKNTANKVFSLLAVSGSIWVALNLLADTSSSASALLWTRLTVIPGVGNAFLFWAFSRVFPDQKIKKAELLLFSLPFAVYILLSQTDLNIISASAGGKDLAVGPLYNLLPVVLLAYIIVAIYNLWRSQHGALPIQKLQVKYIFLGMFLSFLPALVFTAVLPAYGVDGLISLGTGGVLVFVGFSGFAIVKHRLMDIRMVVARSVAYTLLLTTLAVLYGGAVFGVSNLIFPGSQTSGSQNLVYTGLAIILAFTFQPLRRFFEKLTDKVFYRDHYDSQEVLNDVGRVLASEIELEKVLHKTLRIICTQMRIGTGQFMIFEKGRLYKIGHFGPLPSKLLTVPELQEINAKMVVVDELTGGKRKEILEQHNVRVSLRLRTKEEFVGFLLMGDKLSGDIYSSQDTNLLEILSHELAVAIVNAKAYEEIAQFNITLQQKVDQATSRLRVANRNLRELDEAKDEFISMASHQLRTPLTTIKGYLSMLMEGDLGKIKLEQLEFINYAYEASDRMVHLISDLLNVSRMSAGRFHIDRKPTNLVEIIQDEVRSLNTHATAKNLKLTYTGPTKAIPLISLDDEKTRQVIMNFIDNAIYYTREGGVHVSVDLVHDCVEFKVKDTGIGVPKEAQKKLFTKFFRADNAQGVRPDGTGLGLYLAKRVIADQGGKIIFETEEGKGSTFGFSLPLVVSAAQAKKELVNA